jgi:hypothetical protein
VTASAVTLGTASGNTAQATISCADPGQLLSCGIRVNGSGNQLIGLVTTQVEADSTRQTCTATIARALAGGGGAISPSAGASVQAIAICRTS